MFKLKAKVLVLACVFSLSVLSGCTPVADEVSTFARTYTPKGIGMRLAENLSSDSSSSVDSSGSSQSDPPAPAPVQPITGKVTEDPIFKPTEEDKKEDPGKRPGGNENGSGGTIIVPGKPETPSGGHSSSSNSSKPSPSSKPSSSSSSKPSSSSGSSSKPSSSSSPSSSTPEYNPPRNGWYEWEGKTYCFVNGEKLTGWHNINNISYWFNTEGKLSSKAGIDVSKWNGKIDWEKVKADGIEFAFIRAGVRGYVSGKIVYDERFVENVEGATANGIEVGVYFFSQATTAEEGKQEAEWTLNAIEGLNVTGPIVIDTEYVSKDPEDPEPRGNVISREVRTEAVEAFANTVKASGRTPMIYASQSWFENQLDLSKLTGIEKWLARWSASVSWSQPFSIWQSCSDGKVNGINGNVDRNAWKIVS